MISYNHRIHYVQFVCCVFLSLIVSFLIKERGTILWTPAIPFCASLILLCSTKGLQISSSVISQLNFSFMFVLLGSVFYVFPLGPSDLRVDDPIAMFDAQKYALSAVLTIEDGRGLGHWLSFGIERYIVSIYQLFGLNEVNVIAINSLIFLVTIGLFKSIIFHHSDSGLSLWVFVTMVPLTFFYSIQPSKEVLSILVVAMFLWLLIKRRTMGTLKQAVLFSLLFVVAMFIRINLAFFLLLFFCSCYISFDKRLLFRAPLLMAGAACSIYVIHIFSLGFVGVGVDFWIDKSLSLLDANERLALATKSNQDAASASYAIKQYLSPTSLWLNMVFVPVKMVLVWVSPFPLLQDVFSLPSGGASLAEYGQILLASMSGLLNFALIPAILVLIRRFYRLSPSNKLVLAFILVYLAMVAVAYPTQFTRHRTLVEIPMYLLFWRYSRQWFPSYKAVLQGCACYMFMLSCLTMIGLNLNEV